MSLTIVTDSFNISLRKLHRNAKIPRLQTLNSPGFNIYAVEKATIYPNCTKFIPSGWSFNILNENYYPHIYNWPSNALKGIQVASGIIHPDYRDDLGPILYNSGENPFVVHIGMIIGQVVITRFTTNVVYCVINDDDYEDKNKRWSSIDTNIFSNSKSNNRGSKDRGPGVY